MGEREAEITNNLPIIIVAKYDARVPQNQGIIGTLLKAGCKRSRIFTPKKRIRYNNWDREYWQCYVVRLPDEDDDQDIITEAYPCERGKRCSFRYLGRYYTLLKSQKSQNAES